MGATGSIPTAAQAKIKFQVQFHSAAPGHLSCQQDTVIVKLQVL